MKRFKVFVKALAAIIWSCAVLASCNGPKQTSGSVGKKVTFSQMEENTWYRISCDDIDAFVNFQRFASENIRGVFYDMAQWPEAQKKNFFVRIEGNKATVNTDDGRRRTFKPSDLGTKITVTKYVRPDYAPQDFDQKLYRQNEFEVSCSSDQTYGKARGFYTSLPGYENDFKKLLTDGILKPIREDDLSLEMDIYSPADAQGPFPVIMFIHGGAFCAGDKKEAAYQDFCNYFASRGYLTASINYRLGFRVGKGSIQRSGYRAVQDANAAMRYLVHNAQKFDIDTSAIFVAGSSAGAITALNMEFMNDHNKPEATQGGLIRDDLGPIDKSGNKFTEQYDIKAIASLWGALNDIEMLKDGDADIIFFHGTEDRTIPCDEGLPFEQLGENGSKLIFDRMYGSRYIDNHSKEYGITTKFVQFFGCEHALNVDENSQPNENQTIIREDIKDFFFERIVKVPATLSIDQEGFYCVDGTDITDCQWKADGGFVVEQSSPQRIKILWRQDEQDRTVCACGSQKGRIGFELKN